MDQKSKLMKSFLDKEEISTKMNFQKINLIMMHG